MKVTSTGILHGVISDEYGKRGTQFNAHGMPTYSLPLSIQDAPAGTVSYAIVLEDKDAYPVSGGFVWIHWTVANLTRTSPSSHRYSSKHMPSVSGTPSCCVYKMVFVMNAAALRTDCSSGTPFTRSAARIAPNTSPVPER